jgi:hypothetical protein
VALPQFRRQRRCRAGIAFISEGARKRQESLTSSCRSIFFTVKRACIPSATHCLYRAIASAGVTEGASSCRFPSSNTCPGRGSVQGGAGGGIVPCTTLAVLARGAVRKGELYWGGGCCWVPALWLNWPTTPEGEAGEQGWGVVTRSTEVCGDPSVGGGVVSGLALLTFHTSWAPQDGGRGGVRVLCRREVYSPRALTGDWCKYTGSVDYLTVIVYSGQCAWVYTDCRRRDPAVEQLSRGVQKPLAGWDKNGSQVHARMLLGPPGRRRCQQVFKQDPLHCRWTALAAGDQCSHLADAWWLAMWDALLPVVSLQDFRGLAGLQRTA